MEPWGKTRIFFNFLFLFPRGSGCLKSCFTLRAVVSNFQTPVLEKSRRPETDLLPFVQLNPMPVYPFPQRVDLDRSC